MENICRTCLRAPGNLLPLFDDTGLPHKIETICSVQVSETDNLPTRICAECVININLSYNFRRVIINSDKELKQRLLTLANSNNFEPEKVEVLQIKIETDDAFDEETFLHDESGEGEEQTEANNTNEISDRSDNQQRNVRWRIQSQLIALKRRRVYKCKQCDFSTNDYTQCYNHKRNHVVVKSMCNICGKYVRTDNLKKHISIHTDPPVTCKQCGKIFKNSESMRSHVLIHKGVKITCEFCGQVFKYRGGYKRHVRKQHTIGEPLRKVKCTLCEKMFFDKGDLKKHIRSHTGERPYLCQYCKKGFSSSHALKTHIRQHTNEKPYACEFCPMAFHQKVSLTTHLKSKHRENCENTS